jgi:ribonuclease-3 family protein
MNGLTLAYIGDAYYELVIREHLVKQGLGKGNDLHQKAIRFTSASGQAQAMERLMDGLSDAEQDIFKRGRNAHSTHKPKNADLSTYHRASGFECLLGYLYLEHQDARLKELIQKSIAIIEETLE